MKKAKSRAKFGKGLIIVVVLSILTIAAGVASIYLLSQNTTIAQLFGGSDNVYESAHLEKMTINGYSLGDKLTAEIKQYRAEDADFSYYHNDVAFWGEGDVVTGIGFYTFSDTEGHQVTNIETSNIKYEDRKLKTLNDFEETFGLGQVDEKDDSKTITYFQGNYKLTIQSRNDIVYNVILIEQE